ncbi:MULTISPECIES: hypothetical protein [Actibacterium]|uniref:PEP-CTERM protein-sorting domain-containing protein n=1 Tax=Actibacterium naphthalenivorans TaxID=1614693 RepID=A0A840CJC1_9RHOB|nr:MULTISPECIES: hypothetical protein [Actibacterium]MBB4022207.1 hypothetical protein [Actibacterium naphthalenivorans]
MTLLKTLAASAAFSLCAAAASATVVDMIGDQDFADGTAPLWVTDFEAASAGDPAPFNIFVGSDPFRTFGSVEYSHAFSLNSAAPVSASIEIGIFDHDSPAFNPVDTLDIYFDGILQDDTVWRGASGALPSAVTVRSMFVDPALLSDGLLEVGIFAVATGDRRFRGNGIGVDFSKLTINTAAVPLPAGAPLLIGALGLLGFVRKRRRG